MSLATNVTDLATRVASEAKALRTLINGNQSSLTALTTTTKTNLVAAINEIQAAVASASALNDSITSTTTVWSSSKTNTQIIAAVNGVVAAAPTTLDTLNELALALGSDPNFATTVTTALGNRVRFDAAQTLTGPQQTQARANIGAGTSSVVIGTGAGQAADAAALATSLAGKAATTHTHTASQISDGTTIGRNLLLAADAAAVRTLIGAGTGNSNLVIGTTSGTAADAALLATSLAGKAATVHVHAGGDITTGTIAGARLPAASETLAGIVELATSAETTTGTSALLAVHPQALAVELAKQANVVHTHVATDISNSTAIGRSVLTASTIAAATTAIGAATVLDMGDPLSDFVATFNAGLV